MIDFLSVGINRFRKFGFPFQFKIYSRDEITNAIQKYNGIADCFLSISEHQEIDGLIRTFPLFYLMDFDLTNSYSLLDIETEVAVALNWLEDNNLNYQLDFSGRGYHILIELSQRKRIHNIHFRNFYYYITNHLDLKTLDPMCSEIMRIKRIPETVNLKSNKLCTTLLKHEGDPLDIFDFIENVKYKNNEFEYEVKDYSCSTGESKFIFPFNTDFKMPCIFEAINKADVNHVIRWFWVKILQRKGYSFKEILDEAKQMGWDDFDEAKTSYQIDYTMQHSYTIRCRKKKNNDDKYGICVDDCPFRKNIKKRK